MKIDITGQRFGKLVALKDVGSNGNNILWKCKCDCGNNIIVPSSRLRSGNTKSCGCLQIASVTTHGKSKTRLYRIWHGMKTRCNLVQDKRYKDYGGRGIKVFHEWDTNFLSFYNWAIANGYKDNLSIDRIDNNGNYCPENCRWASAKQQMNNTRYNHLVEYNNEVKTVREWAKTLNIPEQRLYHRLNDGWPIKDALTKPKGARR